MAGQDDHRDVVVDCADLREQIEPGELRHHQVEHDEVKHLVADALDRDRRIRERRDLEALGAQEVLQVLQDVRVVVDDEHGQFRRRSQSAAPTTIVRKASPKTKDRGGFVTSAASRGDRI